MCSLCFATAVHRDSHLWLSASGHTAVRFHVVDGTALVQASGVFDSAAITPCRAALDEATNTPYPIVLDLRAVDPPGRVSVALVGAMRRYARIRGAALVLANVPPPWCEALEAAGVAHWCATECPLPTAERAAGQGA